MLEALDASRFLDAVDRVYPPWVYARVFVGDSCTFLSWTRTLRLEHDSKLNINLIHSIYIYILACSTLIKSENIVIVIRS